MGVSNTRDGGDALPQRFGDTQVRRPIVSDGAHVDLRRDAEVENLRHHVSGLEVEHFFGKRVGQHLAQLANVILGGLVPLPQRNQDNAVIDADRCPVAEGIIVGSGWQANIVDDQLSLVLGYDLADLVFDRLEDLLGLLDPGSGGARTCS